MQYDMQEKEKDRAVKYADIESKERIAGMKEMGSDIRDGRRYDEDTDDNGIDDTLDLRRTDVDENFKNNTIRVKEGEV